MDTEQTAQPKQFGALLLIFRWLSLSPVLWLFFSPAQPAAPARQTLWIAGIAGGTTLLETVFQRQLWQRVSRYPWLLALDLLQAIIVLTISGADTSLFLLYAFSPLLAGAVFFPTAQLIAFSGLFTASYILAALIANAFTGVTVSLSRMYLQIISAWIFPMLLHYPAQKMYRAADEIEQAQRRFSELLDDNRTLAAEYAHLEIIHELTSFLQGASNAQEVQKRLLTTATDELGFSRAVMALVNRDIERLEEWRSAPDARQNTFFAEPLAITPDNGLLTQIILDGQARWVAPRHKLTNNRHLNEWLGNEHWLVLPIPYQEQPAAVLMVTGEATRTFNFSDRIWATLASIVSQSGVALGTLAHIQSLAREKERNRIARDIHDSVAQSLFGMVFTLDACVKLLPDHAEDVREELRNLRMVAEQVRQAVRESIIEQWSTSMTSRKFKADLRKHVVNCSPNHVFHIDFNIDGDFDGLPVHIQQTLYRVSQEALANTAHHSGVTAARLYLYVEPDEVFLSIRDKGKGFVPGQVMANLSPAEHFGLHGIQERVQTIGGLCDILSQPEQGTQILVRVPLQGEKTDDSNR